MMNQSNSIDQLNRSNRKTSLVVGLTLLFIVINVACNRGTIPAQTFTPASTQTRSATATFMPTSTDMPTSTNTATSTATSLPTSTSTSRSTSTPTDTPTPFTCPGAPEVTLRLDDWAMVSMDPPFPNRLREQPLTDSELIGQVQPGDNVLVLDGPRCGEGFTWWYVRSSDGLDGWTAEGNSQDYWLLPYRAVTATWESQENVVTITANQVDGADDIEAAIILATAENTRPGTVILDGQYGPFTFSSADRSLNIFVSNLTLRGVNQATIENCVDGLFFDDLQVDHILVEGIDFRCVANGVVATGVFNSVVLKNNLFRAEMLGISLGGESQDWLITENVIEAGRLGINVTGGKRMVISNNQISGEMGMSLSECVQVEARDNLIDAAYQGVLLEGSSNNLVKMNAILNVIDSGIWLGPGVRGNFIQSNRVSCAARTDCITIDATSDLYEFNAIDENLP